MALLLFALLLSQLLATSIASDVQITGKLGSSVTIACPQVADVINQKNLFKNGINLYYWSVTGASSPKSDKYELKEFGVEIKKLEKADAGVYFCKYTSRDWKEFKIETDLAIVSQVQCSVDPDIKTEFADGDPVNLTCSTKASEGVTLQWEDDKGEVYSQVENQNSTWTTVASKDWNGKNVKCVSSFGDYREECDLGVLKVLFRAEVAKIVRTGGSKPVKETASTWMFRNGSTLELTCEASGNPEIQVTWSFTSIAAKQAKRGLESQEKIIETGNKLSLSLAADKAGLYTCKAENTLGSEQKSINLEIASSEVIGEIEKKNDSNEIPEGVIIAVVVVVLVIGLVVALFFCYRRRSNRQKHTIKGNDVEKEGEEMQALTKTNQKDDNITAFSHSPNDTKPQNGSNSNPTSQRDSGSDIPDKNPASIGRTSPSDDENLPPYDKQ